MKDRVKNLEDEDVGRIKDFMIDTTTGRVAYAVLSFGGFLGVGDKLFAVPWQSLQIDPDDECFVMHVDKDRLKEAPGFDKDHWPKTDDMTWQRDVHSFYGIDPYWE
jgi:hypothetical protein